LLAVVEQVVESLKTMVALVAALVDFVLLLLSHCYQALRTQSQSEQAEQVLLRKEQLQLMEVTLRLIQLP
jgi:hypothetical protein